MKTYHVQIFSMGYWQTYSNGADTLDEARIIEDRTRATLNLKSGTRIMNTKTGTAHYPAPEPDQIGALCALQSHIASIRHSVRLIENTAESNASWGLVCEIADRDMALSKIAVALTP